MDTAILPTLLYYSYKKPLSKTFDEAYFFKDKKKAYDMCHIFSRLNGETRKAYDRGVSTIPPRAFMPSYKDFTGYLISTIPLP